MHERENESPATEQPLRIEYARNSIMYPHASSSLLL